MNPYKKFCVSFVFLSLFFLMVIHPALFFANLGIPDAPSRTIDNWFKIKEAHAQNSSGRRIFVLSCSTALYGVDTSVMEQELGITAVNFATTVSLRKYMFDRIKTSLTSGDIIIMPLEYHVYRDTRTEEEVCVYILEYDPDYFYSLPLIEKISCIYTLKTLFLFKRIVARIISPSYGDSEDNFLSSKYLNANGDLTSNTYEASPYKKPYFPEKQNFAGYKVPGSKTAHFIGDFVEYCKGAHIDLYATWPPLYSVTEKKEFFDHDAEVLNGIKNLWLSLNVTILGDYRDAFFEADECYNSPRHLNDRGKAKYTKHLIELIKPYI